MGLRARTGSVRIEYSDSDGRGFGVPLRQGEATASNDADIAVGGGHKPQNALDAVRERIRTLASTGRRPVALFIDPLPAAAGPWRRTNIYDFDLPKAISGAPVPKFCDGFTRKKPDGEPYSCGECLASCLHPDKEEAVCVYGFWGTRHQVEQLLTDKLQRPRELQPIGDGAVAYTVGLAGAYLDQIPKDLTEKLKNFARKIPDKEDLPLMLWTKKRPAVLLLVGHYKTAPVPDEEEGPRITLPGKRFVTPRALLKERERQRQRKQERWNDPRSVVLLAACSGGVVDIKSKVNFVNIFTGVGAGAVIGPETIIYEGLARRFAIDLCEGLVNRSWSVGAAVLEFRRNLLRNLNPLGLVFTPYGFADLAAPPATAPSTVPASAHASVLH